jgi:hypothetical protein
MFKNAISYQATVTYVTYKLFKNIITSDVYYLIGPNIRRPPIFQTTKLNIIILSIIKNYNHPHIYF